MTLLQHRQAFQIVLRRLPAIRVAACLVAVCLGTVQAAEPLRPVSERFTGTDVREVPDFNTFFRHHATYPFYSDAVWYLTQMRRWGQIAEQKSDDWYMETARDVYRPDVYALAARALVQEGKMKASDFPDFDSEDGFKPPQSEFIDGVTYDGREPNAYRGEHGKDHGPFARKREADRRAEEGRRARRCEHDGEGALEKAARRRGGAGRRAQGGPGRLQRDIKSAEEIHRKDHEDRADNREEYGILELKAPAHGCAGRAKRNHDRGERRHRGQHAP